MSHHVNDSDKSCERGRRRQRVLLRAEQTCWMLAILLVLPAAAAVGARSYLSNGVLEPNVDLDQSLWSATRRETFAALSNRVPPLAGVLRVGSGSIPVYGGADEITMTLGAGHLRDSAPLHGSGNIALSAHRDGAFRVLKDVDLGDRIELRLADRRRQFEVVDLRVVDPHQVEVLAPTAVTSLTLITCYPFYYVGSAPQRYVVRAQLVDAGDASEPRERDSI